MANGHKEKNKVGGMVVEITPGTVAATVPAVVNRTELFAAWFQAREATNKAKEAVRAMQRNESNMVKAIMEACPGKTKFNYKGMELNAIKRKPGEGKESDGPTYFFKSPGSTDVEYID